MPKDPQKHSQPRQRPVSCSFCRKRKLRCSRQAPCSNCISRGVPCDLELVFHSSGDGVNPDVKLLERVRELEERVINQETQQRGMGQSLGIGAEQIKTPNLPSDAQAPERLHDEVAWLESIYSNEEPSVNSSSGRIIFRTCSIQRVIEAKTYTHQSSVDPFLGFDASRCIWLPYQSEARILMEKYINEIEYLHHVVHCPSLPTMIDDIYTCLNNQGHIKSGPIMLLLGMLASCTHCWLQRDCKRGLFSSPAEAKKLSPYWCKAFEDVLNIAHRTTSVSIEGVQGIVIASFVIGNLEGGISRRCRSFYTIAILLARELGLHCLDRPSNMDMTSTIQKEMGRRLWWYLAGSDWTIAARFGGSTQGVYLCHLRQMIVKKPLNINDEELIDGVAPIDHPLSQPTTMSYSLLRIRLSEISRSIVDRTPLVVTDVYGLGLDVIMDVDTELQMLLNDIPPFFSMPITALTEIYHLSPSEAAKIVHQGYTFRSLLYSQRCKLHLPYFSRGFVDSAYASSRDICFQSARQIIKTETDLEISGLCTGLRYRSLGLLLGVFMASIVLLIDFCHNHSLPQQEKQQGEIADALRILEEARHDSETAAKVLEALMHTLRKHKVAPPRHADKQSRDPNADNGWPQDKPNEPTIYHAPTSQPIGETVMTPLSIPSSGVGGASECGSYDSRAADGDDISSYFNDFAQSFEQGGTLDWNSIFADLDSSFS